MDDEHAGDLLRLAREQSLAGILCRQLMASGVRLGENIVPHTFALLQTVKRQNQQKNVQAAWLCRTFQKEGIRMLVMKGQTMSALYPDPFVRQSGDIDFYIHPSDWERACLLVRRLLAEEGNGMPDDLKDTNSDKHIEFRLDDIQYEMHRRLLSFNRLKYQRYWECNVVPAIWECITTVQVPLDTEGKEYADIPTLSPTYNALYTFIHLFHHLIIEGVGLRQFCDWMMVLERHVDAIDASLLQTHLRGLGLENAYCEMGTLLTDHLGLPEQHFPFPLTEGNRVRLSSLWTNVLDRGNFGQNKSGDYVQPNGVLHGLQHLIHIAGQQRLFWRYAPGEVLMCIPMMFRWWCVKLRRMVF